MRSSRTLGTELWREIVQRITEGVIVFNQRGIVIYANDEAARLLDYKSRDVLELDRDDIVSLFDRDRMDGRRFATDFMLDQPAPGAPRSYEVVSTRRRLMLSPFNLELEFGTVRVLLIKENVWWRSELISQTFADQMQGPLSIIEHYTTMLNDRLQDPSAHPYEHTDLTRIIHESLNRAMAVWQNLTDLHGTEPTPHRTQNLQMIRPADAFAVIARQLDPAHPQPELDIPADLPQIRASINQFYPALYTLLESLVTRLPEGGNLLVKGYNHQRYVQFSLYIAPHLPNLLRMAQFDVLPLATVEQIIMLHGGRVWADGNAIHFSLPVAIPPSVSAAKPTQ
jgi:two-component system, NtrC family, sensor histidine kinase KinB